MTELAAIDEREVGPEARLPLIEELTTGAQKARMTDAITERVENGDRLVSVGGFISNVVSVDVNGDRALVEDCSLDRGELYSADGNLITPAADTFGLRTTVLVLVDGSWLVEDFWAAAEQCDPEDER
jgi:hypothetical protein